MHEQSIVESLVSIALENARKANATRILNVHVVVGELSGVVDDAMGFYFGFMTRDTIAAGAGLSFEHVEARLRCRSCGTTFAAREHDFHCPDCGKPEADIVSGRELYVDRLEVE
jgi:hydrogenase nickel incorporation protein HypA/HybF